MPDAVPPSLTFEIERNGESAVVKCHGRMVAWSTDDFHQAVKSLLPETKTIVIDLKELTFVDSMGLGTLVRLYVSARQSGSKLTVEHLGKQVRNVLSITNLLSVLAQAESHNINIA
jgi:anti-sigma B factor antagonist